MKRLVSALLGLTTAGFTPLWGQTGSTTREGDSTVVAGVDAQTRILHDSTERWAFTFTRANLSSEPGAFGTEVQAGLRKGVPVRIITGGWTPRGKFGAEYYRVGGELVFVYESTELFRELAGPGWRNFKGLAGWERRTYLVAGRVAYVETTGDGAPPVSAERLHANLNRILAALSP
jgi:hypothetical protein